MLSLQYTTHPKDEERGAFMKKTISLLLALVLLFSAVPFASAAHKDDCELSVDWNKDGICDFCRGTMTDEPEAPTP